MIGPNLHKKGKFEHMYGHRHREDNWKKPKEKIAACL